MPPGATYEGQGEDHRRESENQFEADGHGDPLSRPANLLPSGGRPARSRPAAPPARENLDPTSDVQECMGFFAPAEGRFFLKAPLPECELFTFEKAFELVSSVS